MELQTAKIINIYVYRILYTFIKMLAHLKRNQKKLQQPQVTRLHFSFPLARYIEIYSIFKFKMQYCGRYTGRT